MTAANVYVLEEGTDALYRLEESDGTVYRLEESVIPVTIDLSNSVYDEEFDGSDCDGSDGGTSRTLTLNNAKTTIGDGFLVFLDGILLPSTVLTITHNSSSSTVAFTDPVFDSQKIRVVAYVTQ